MDRTTFLRRILALFLLVASILVGCSDSSGNSDAGAPIAPPTGGNASVYPTGTVLLGGVLLEAPYRVEAVGTEIRINEVRALSFAPPPAPLPATYSETAPDLNGFQLADLARRTYLAAGGGQAGQQAALARLQSHPAVSTVATEDSPAGTNISVTDKAGFTATFRPFAPDSAGRKLTASQIEEVIAETLRILGGHLAQQGGLVFSSTGNFQLVPAAGIQDLLASTDRAFALAADARRAELLDLYQDEDVVEDILAHYKPRPASSAAARSLPQAAPMVPQAGSNGPAGCCKTPGSKNAWVYRTLAGGDAAPFIDAVSKEGYNVRVFDFHGRAQPPGSGLNAFGRTSRAGAVYFITHSSPRGIALQSFADEGTASRALGSLRAQNAAGDIAWWQESDGTWWMDVTPQGIGKVWSSNDSIVHSASCYSFSLAGAFNAREFFGYSGITSAVIARPHTQKLWQRLTGEDPGDGSLRRAAVAYDGGKGYASALWLFGIFRSATKEDWLHDDRWDAASDPTGQDTAIASGAVRREISAFSFRDGSPDGDTVLSPSVVQAAPLEPVFVGQDTVINVGFDALMDTAVNANLALEVEGCAQRTGDATWQFGSLITMPARATSAGTAKVTVRAPSARSPASILLDGNANRATGVVPNADDYVFTFSCVAPVTTPPQEPPPATVLPSLLVNPPTLSIVHVMGSSSCPQSIGSIFIGETVSGPLEWTISDIPPFVDLSRTQGTLNSTADAFEVSAEFNCNVPARGTYSGVLSVAGRRPGTPDVISSKTVNISVTVD